MAETKKLYPDANFLKVVSPLKALQRLAERHREEHDVPTIGITGSNGKTTVKEWVSQLASPSLYVTRSPRSYNSQVGVPLSVWLLDDRTELGIFEAGISQPGEMAALKAIVQPTIGIMTNIGEAHQENFASIEEKCMEKLSLFDDAETLIYDADDTVIAQCLEQSRFHGRRLGWSRTDAQAPLFIKMRGRVRAFLYASRSTVTFIVVFSPGFSVRLPRVSFSALEYMWSEDICSGLLPLLVSSIRSVALSLSARSTFISLADRVSCGALRRCVSVICAN